MSNESIKYRERRRIDRYRGQYIKEQMAEIVQNTILGTRQKLELILQEMDIISREIISQLNNSSSSFDIQTLIDMLIERQDYLAQQMIIVRQHQELERQLQLKRDEIFKCEN